MRLRPCPFCGGEAEICDEHKWIGKDNNGYHRKYISCRKCSCRTMSFDWDDRKSMINAWNRRVHDSQFYEPTYYVDG